MQVEARIAELLSALNNPSLPGIELSLGRMQALLAALGNPERRLPPVIHLAGTNGKGSTLAFLQAIYQAAGYRVHAYTSPHLVRFNERIVLAGAEITDAQLLPLLERVHGLMATHPATYFEATTAAALLAFAEHPADVVLLETGLGGRLDATNVVAQPVMTVLTPISADHKEFLGDTVALIAMEKAGIMKAGVPCISGTQVPEVQAVLTAAAGNIGAPLSICGDNWAFAAQADGISVTYGEAQWKLPLPSLAGAHQAQNAALASVVAQSCSTPPVSMEAMAQGIAHAQWPGRLQRLSHGPLVDAWSARGAVMLDGAHNVAGAEALAAWIAQQEQPVTLLCGMMQRKEAAAFLAPLAPYVRQVITVPVTGEDCYTPQALAETARAAGMQATAAANMEDACSQLQREAMGILLITGSLFLVGEVLRNHG